MMSSSSSSYGSLRSSPTASGDDEASSPSLRVAIVDEEQDNFQRKQQYQYEESSSDDVLSSPSSSWRFPVFASLIVVVIGAFLLVTQTVAPGSIQGVLNAITSTKTVGETSTTTTTTTTTASSDASSSSSASGSTGASGATFTISSGTDVEAISTAVNDPHANGEIPDDPTEPTDPNEIVFSMARVGYDPLVLDENILNYKFMSDYDTVLEPYVKQQLWVEDIDDTVYYRYVVCPEIFAECDQGIMALNSNVTETVEVTINCSPGDRYTISVEEFDAVTNQNTRSSTAAAVCMYVRREVRTYSEADLDDVMDAMYVMWTTSDEEGQELYGDNYHSASYMLKMHHFNAAWQDSDHIHEGNGFMTQHIKMTNIFEMAMQAVDPSVSLPYWDFTIDDMSGKAAHNSIVMTEAMFGSMTQPVNLTWGFTYGSDAIIDAAIPDGRWAYLLADMNEDYDDLRAGYGYMRAPWNMNPSPYVSRFTYDYQIGISLPTCSQHYAIIQETNMMDFFYNMQNDPHATTHSLSGGIYGCDMLDQLLDAGYITDTDAQKAICSKWVFYLKEFYRYNYITPKTDCEVDVDDVQAATCGFTCVADSEDVLLANLKTKIENNVPSDMSDDGWTAWKDFICTGDGGKVFSGDHLESASPTDPSFWVIHPTLERLLHAKLMAGGFEDESWATDAKSDSVCDKAACYYDGTYDYHDECCLGHYSDSQLFNSESGNRTQFFGETNAEIVTNTDPRSHDYSMPYIYDTFTWNHCPEVRKSHPSPLSLDFSYTLKN